MNNTVIRADIYMRYDGVYLSAIFSDDKDTISRIKSWVFKELFVSDYDDNSPCARRASFSVTATMRSLSSTSDRSASY